MTFFKREELEFIPYLCPLRIKPMSLGRRVYDISEAELRCFKQCVWYNDDDMTDISLATKQQRCTINLLSVIMEDILEKLSEKK